MRITPLIASTLLLAACNPPQDGTANEISLGADASNEAGGGEDQGQQAPDAEQADEAAQPSGDELAMANTAWRVTGEDGAIYTTFLDPEGQYRDMKNGEPWADGTWERLADGRLCFTPSDETRAGECWTLGKHKKNGTMRITSDSGRETLLQQVTYLAPTGPEEG